MSSDLIDSEGQHFTPRFQSHQCRGIFVGKDSEMEMLTVNRDLRSPLAIPPTHSPMLRREFIANGSILHILPVCNDTQIGVSTIKRITIHVIPFQSAPVTNPKQFSMKKYRPPLIPSLSGIACGIASVESPRPPSDPFDISGINNRKRQSRPIFRFERNEGHSFVFTQLQPWRSEITNSRAVVLLVSTQAIGHNHKESAASVTRNGDTGSILTGHRRVAPSVSNPRLFQQRGGTLRTQFYHAEDCP